MGVRNGESSPFGPGRFGASRARGADRAATVEDVARSYSRAVKSAPYLERDQERALAVRWRDGKDEAALHELAASHMRLVMAAAARFRRYGLPLQDLVQEGNVGMLEAAARFEPGRDVRFSTYASWWIRAQIQDYVLRNWSIVRGGTSSGQKALFFNLRRLRARLARDGAVPPAQLYDHLAKALGTDRAEVERMDARLSRPDLSLNAPALSNGGDEDGAERGDFLVDPAPSPEALTEAAVDGDRRAAALHEALTHLSERERVIMRRRRLVDEPATLEELGAELGVSKERVRQLEARALEKLRQRLLGQALG